MVSLTHNILQAAHSYLYKGFFLHVGLPDTDFVSYIKICFYSKPYSSVHPGPNCIFSL